MATDSVYSYSSVQLRRLVKFGNQAARGVARHSWRHSHNTRGFACSHEFIYHFSVCICDNMLWFLTIWEYKFAYIVFEVWM